MSIAKALILTAVLAALAGPVAAQPAGTPVYSQKPEANALFLKGLDLLAKGDPRTGGSFANAHGAIEAFQQAADADPGLALAYVDMTRAYLLLTYSNPGASADEDVMPAARAALAKAIAIDPKLADAHLISAAIAYNLDFDWAKADREYSEGLRLQPDNAAAHANYAVYLSYMGRFDAALDQAKKAEAIAPSDATDFAFGRIYFAMHRYAEAADYDRRSLAKQDNIAVRFYLALALAAEGDFDEAVPEFEKTIIEKNAGAAGGLAYAYAITGRKAEAQSLLDRLNAGHEFGRPVAYNMAKAYLGLGDKAESLKWLAKAYDDHENWIPLLKIDPAFDPLRSDPGFEALMGKLNFS